ncbi:hypothetical protein ACSZNM_19210 [Aeromonas hydrophila]
MKVFLDKLMARLHSRYITIFLTTTLHMELPASPNGISPTTLFLRLKASIPAHASHGLKLQ